MEEWDEARAQLLQSQLKHKGELEVVQRDLEARLEELAQKDATLDTTAQQLASKSEQLEKNQGTGKRPSQQC